MFLNLEKSFCAKKMSYTVEIIEGDVKWHKKMNTIQGLVIGFDTLEIKEYT